MNTPTISVVITCYNKGDLLLRAIDSLNNQSDQHFETLIIDDCSTDSQTIKILQQVQKLNGIKLFKHNANRGAAGAKNSGISKSKGEIIVLLDADDTLPPQAIQHIRNAFIKHNDADFVYGDYNIHTESGIISKISCNKFTTNINYLDPKQLALKWTLLGTAPFRKQLWEKVGGYNQLYPRTDDVDFQRRCILAGAMAYYIPEIIYEWHPSQTGNNALSTSLDDILLQLRTFEFYYRYLPRHIFIYRWIKIFFKTIYLKSKR